MGDVMEQSSIFPRYRAVFGQDTLIPCLLKYQMNQAVIAILNSKCIQKSLGQDKEWIECLETGLEIVCNTTRMCNIDMIKAIVEAHAAASGCKRTLNGSSALTYAIEASNAECAQYIIDSTKIKFDGRKGREYFERILNSSMELNKIKLLCDTILAISPSCLGTQHEVPLQCVYKSPIYIGTLLHEYIMKSKSRSHFPPKILVNLFKLTTENLHEQRFESQRKYLFQILYCLTPEQCIQVLPMLKDNGVDFCHVNKANMNAFKLHIVCLRNDVFQCSKVLQYLVEIDVDPSQESDKGVVPLMNALENNPGVDVIKWLLTISPRRHINKDGQGYFHYLMRSCCDFDCLTRSCIDFLQEDEDINLQDNSGKTPLMYLMRVMHIAVLNTCFDFNQVQEFFGSLPFNVHLIDNDGRNVLHHLCKAPYGPFSKYPERERPIYHENSDRHCRLNVLEPVYDLLVDKFKVDHFLKDKNGVTPHMLARSVMCPLHK